MPGTEGREGRSCLPVVFTLRETGTEMREHTSQTDAENIGYARLSGFRACGYVVVALVREGLGLSTQPHTIIIGHRPSYNLVMSLRTSRGFLTRNQRRCLSNKEPVVAVKSLHDERARRVVIVSLFLKYRTRLSRKNNIQLPAIIRTQTSSHVFRRHYKSCRLHYDIINFFLARMPKL